MSDLIDTPAGQRNFRTILDKMGMGGNLDACNEQNETTPQGTYATFEMGGLLKVKG